MRVKWKCVWKVLKPKIIAALIIILIVVICVGISILLMEYWVSTMPPVNFTNMSVDQQQQLIATSCGGCGFSLGSLIAFLMIGGGLVGIIILGIELIKSLAEALKPCIIWKEE
jgi:hypothetical protein